MAASTITQIDSAYLKHLEAQLQDLLTQVEQQLEGLGTKGVTSNTTSFVEPLTSTLTISAGGASFDAGATLTKALNAMGGSVNTQLTWLKGVIAAMIPEVRATIESLKGTESLNNESMDTLLNDLKNTIGLINTPAGSGTNTNSPPGTT
jgi:hypothetical protein